MQQPDNSPASPLALLQLREDVTAQLRSSWIFKVTCITVTDGGKQKNSHISLCALFPDVLQQGGSADRLHAGKPTGAEPRLPSGSVGAAASWHGTVALSDTLPHAKNCTAVQQDLGKKPLPTSSEQARGRAEHPAGLQAHIHRSGSIFFPQKKQWQRLHLLGARRAGNHEPPPGAAQCWRAATRQRAGSNPNPRDFMGKRRGKRRWCFKKSQEGEAKLLPPALLLLWFLSPSYPARCNFKYLQLATKPCKVGKRAKYCLFLLLMQSLND